MQQYSKTYSITCKYFLKLFIVLNFSNISSFPQKKLGIMIYTALNFISKSRQPFNYFSTKQQTNVLNIVI